MNINKTKQRFLSNKFLLSFSLLASGSIIAQIISMLVSPISTRLFSPEEFGYYTLITTAVSLFGPIICLKYDMAIVTAKTEDETLSVIKLSFYISLVLSIILSLIYTITFIENEDNSSKILYFMIIAFMLFLYGINSILVSYNNKKSLYKLISSVTVIKSFVNNSLLIISGLLNLGVLGIVGSQISGYSAGLSKQYQVLRKNYADIKKININDMKKVSARYIRQPMYNAPSALVTTSVYSFINIFIKKFYSVNQLGLYSLSYRILGIPFSVISANIARIFFDNASKEFIKHGNFSRTFKKTVIILSLTILPIMLIMALIAPWIFSIVFGKEWMEAGNYVRLLTPMFAIRLISESMTTSYIVAGKQNLELKFQSALLFSELLVFLITYIGRLDMSTFLLLISLIYILIHGNMMISMYRMSKEIKND